MVDIRRFARSRLLATAVQFSLCTGGASFGRSAVTSHNAVSPELLNAYERGLGEHYGVTRERS
jgi:hypothetical protein